MSKRAREERERVVSWCGVDRKKIVKNEEWKKSIRIENFYLCCSNAISRRPRDDNDEDIGCESCEGLFLSLYLRVDYLGTARRVCVCRVIKNRIVKISETKIQLNDLELN